MRSVMSRALWLAVVAGSVCLPLLPAGAAGEFRAYVTTAEGVTVIDTASNTVVANISLALPASITVSPDGALLFVPQPEEDRIAVVDARTYTLLHAILVPGRPGRIALTPDGALGVLITRGACAPPEQCDAVSVIDARKLDLLGTIPLPGRPGGFALTPDGVLGIVTTQRVCEPQGQCAGADTVSIFDVVERTLSAVALPGRPGNFALTPDGARGLVTTQRSCEPPGQCVGADTLSIFDVVESRVVAAIPPWGPFFEPGGMAITPNGASAYVMEEDVGPIGIIDMHAGTRRATVPLICCATGQLAMAPDGAYVYAPFHEFGAFISIMDTATNIMRGIIDLGEQGGTGLMVPDHFSGRTYVSVLLSNTDPGLAIMVLEGRERTATIPIPEGAWSMAFSQEPARAYVVLYTTGAVVVIDAVSLTVIETIPVGDRPFEVVLGRMPPTSMPTPTVTPALATATPTQPPRSNNGCAVTPRGSPTGALAWVAPMVLLFLRRRQRAARGRHIRHMRQPDQRGDAEGSVRGVQIA